MFKRYASSSLSNECFQHVLVHGRKRFSAVLAQVRDDCCVTVQQSSYYECSGNSNHVELD